MMIITGGEFKGRKMLSPDEAITRPTLSKVRMGVFNTLFSLVEDFSDKSFLDLFGGSGIMGIEALSRGFKKVTVFEKNPKAVQIIKKNYQTVGKEADLRIGDSLKLIKNLETKYDIIYIDPPYESNLYSEVFEAIPTDCLIVAEHSNPIETTLGLIKTKNYGGKMVSFYRK